VNLQNRALRDLTFYLSPRYILGLILILASFGSAFVITSAADQSTSVWAANVNLAPGAVIQAGDLTPVRVRLIDNAAQYLSTDADLVGAAVLRPIGAAELIPAVAAQVDSSLQRVPLSISRQHLPAGITSGAIVDIYAYEEREFSDQGAGRKPRLLLANASIEALDESSKDLGGDLIITVLVPAPLVNDLIDAIAGSRFILVRRVGS
jgi:hypothetical protein